MPCPKNVTAVFSDINFSNPGFPWTGFINGQIELPKRNNPPQGYCEFYVKTSPNTDGVYQVIDVITGDNYYKFEMHLYRQVEQTTTGVNVFSGNGNTMPVQNLTQYGGAATLT